MRYHHIRRVSSYVLRLQPYQCDARLRVILHDNTLLKNFCVLVKSLIMFRQCYLDRVRKTSWLGHKIHSFLRCRHQHHGNHFIGCLGSFKHNMLWWNFLVGFSKQLPLVRITNQNYLVRVDLIMLRDEIHSFYNATVTFMDDLFTFNIQMFSRPLEVTYSSDIIIARICMCEHIPLPYFFQSCWIKNWVKRDRYE